MESKRLEKREDLDLNDQNDLTDTSYSLMLYYKFLNYIEEGGD